MEKTTKEVLHTQGEWKLGAASLPDGKINICGPLKLHESGYVIAQVFMNGDYSKGQANAEIICKAVNERQKLLDSNRELKMELGKWQNWFKNPEMGPRDLLTAADIYETAKTAINNAKNNQP